MVVGLCVDFSFSFVFVLFLELCFFGIVFFWNCVFGFCKSLFLTLVMCPV